MGQLRDRMEQDLKFYPADDVRYEPTHQEALERLARVTRTQIETPAAEGAQKAEQVAYVHLRVAVTVAEQPEEAVPRRPAPGRGPLGVARQCARIGLSCGTRRQGLSCAPCAGPVP